MEKIYIANIESPALGSIWLAAAENGLIALEFPADQDGFTAHLQQKYAASVEFAPQNLTEPLTQINEYLAGTRTQFTFALDWSVMGDFQQQALRATLQIPYGQTRTYKEVAAAIGRPLAARAVGRAEATNPIPLVIPCHRVLGSDGQLHGYGAGAGLQTKTWLLDFETRHAK